MQKPNWNDTDGQASHFETFDPVKDYESQPTFIISPTKYQGKHTGKLAPIM